MTRTTPDETTRDAAAQDARRRRAEARRRTRGRRVRRRRVASAAIVLLAGIAGLAAALGWPHTGAGSRGAGSPGSAVAGSPQPRPQPRPAANTARPPSFAVGMRVMRFVDTSRRIPRPGRPPRTLVTYIRYPAIGRASGVDLAGAPAAVQAGRFPLIVFGHGFGVSPQLYAALLRAWASAGYVVAAPAFPLEVETAPGGPDETDLVNQPGDVSFVISRMLAVNAARGPLRGMLDTHRIAVAGQSDGGDTALAVAYGRLTRDRRVAATIVLAGAQSTGVGGFSYRPNKPPLFAAQGTADAINLASATDSFFAAAGRPKFLLRLLGAAHIPPYSSEQPQLRIVELTSTAFLDYYLKRESGALGRLAAAASVRGVSSLAAAP